MTGEKLIDANVILRYLFNDNDSSLGFYVYPAPICGTHKPNGDKQIYELGAPETHCARIDSRV